MIKLNKEEWIDIITQQAKSKLNAREFCAHLDIHLQTFYARRHALGMATKINRHKPALPVKSASQFVQAKLAQSHCTIVMQTREAQLSFSTSCDPLWVASVLKGLGA
jgi:hypothetical protein